jgi:hypothetical protein
VKTRAVPDAATMYIKLTHLGSSKEEAALSKHSNEVLITYLEKIQ